MTASLTAPYALPGENSPTQPAHQKGLEPSAPHGSPVVVPVKAIAKPVVKIQELKVTTVQALPQEPITIQKPAEVPTKLPDIPAMGN